MIEKYLKGLVLRPFAILCFSFFISLFIFLSYQKPVSAAHFFISLILTIICLTLTIIFKNQRSQKALFFSLFSFSMGLLLSTAVFLFGYLKTVEKYDYYNGKNAEIIGEVLSVKWESNYNNSYIVESKTIDKRKSTLIFNLTTNEKLYSGDIIRIKGKFESISQLSDDELEFKNSYLSDGIFLLCKADSISLSEKAGFSLMQFSQTIQKNLSQIFYDYLGDYEGGFASALLLGNKAKLGVSVKRDFARLGISHILAVSGLHLSVVCGLFDFLLCKTDIRFRRFIRICIIIAFMFITGLSSSVLRSGIMLIIVTVANSLKRNSDIFTNVGTALLVITIFDPFSAVDVGLQLSAGAVIGIAFATEKGRKIKLKASKNKSPLLSFLDTVRRALHVSGCVVIFILPILWANYDFLSIVSPPSSVVFSFLATIIIWALPFILILSPIKPLCSFFSFYVKIIIDATVKFAAFISHIPNITVPLNGKSSLILCFVAFLCFILFSVSRKKLRVISGFLCAAAVLSVVVSGYAVAHKTYENPVIFTFSKNSCDTIVTLCNNKTVIIDMGNGQFSIFSETVSEIEKRGITDIDALVLTHYHNGYSSSLSRLCDKVIVRKIIFPGDGNFMRIKDFCENNKIPFSTFEYDKKFTLFDGLQIKFNNNLYLKRSVQPIVSFDFYCAKGNFTYLGASYFEASDCKLNFQKSVIIGSHGPKYKQIITHKFPEGTNIIAIGNSEKYYCK